MKPTENHWSREDLELFSDGEMEGERLQRLGDDLRRDADLRARLADVRRLDEEIRDGLLSPACAGPAHPWARAGRLAAAIGFMATTAAAGWLWTHTPSQLLPTDPPAVAPDYEPIRVVLSLPINPTKSDPGPIAPPAHTNTPGTGPLLERLARSLAGGGTAHALDLIESANAHDRDEVYRYLGEVIRSAQVAESLLYRLSPEEQVAVCRAWAPHPAVRTVAFDCLRRLSDEPAVAERVAAAAAQLSTNPELRPWLRSYLPAAAG